MSVMGDDHPVVRVRLSLEFQSPKGWVNVDAYMIEANAPTSGERDQIAADLFNQVKQFMRAMPPKGSQSNRSDRQ